MTIFEPKIINLGDKVVITGDKTLVFATLDEYNSNKKKIFSEVNKSFVCNLREEYAGFCGKADKETLSLTFLPTMQCNLRCTYCYADGGVSKKKLTFVDSKYVLDQMVLQYSEAKKINLFFAGGGEPLLNFELISKIVDYVKSIHLEPTIRIVTNGTKVLDYLDWLIDNKVYLRISFDGSTNSVARPGVSFNSGEKLNSVFNTLKEKYPKELLSVQMTITNANVNSMPKDVLNIIKKYNIDAIKIESVHSSLSDRSKIVKRADPKEFANKFIETLDLLVSKNITAYLDTSYLSLPGVSYFCALRNKLIVSPFGVLGSCVENINSNNENNSILWKLNHKKEINFVKIKDYQQKQLAKYYPENYLICSKCNLVHICKSNCPIRLILGKKTEGPYPYNCAISQVLIPAFFKKCAENEKYLRIVFGENFSVDEKCV